MPKRGCGQNVGPDIIKSGGTTYYRYYAVLENQEEKVYVPEFTEAEEIVQKGRRKSYKALYLDAKEDRDYWFKQYKAMEKKCEELATDLLIIKGKKNE